MPVDADTSSIVMRCTALAPAIRAVSLSYGLGRLAFGILYHSFAVEALDGCGVEVRKEGGRGSGSTTGTRRTGQKLHERKFLCTCVLGCGMI